MQYAIHMRRRKRVASNLQAIHVDREVACVDPPVRPVRLDGFETSCRQPTATNAPPVEPQGPAATLAVRDVYALPVTTPIGPPAIGSAKPTPIGPSARPLTEEKPPTIGPPTPAVGPSPILRLCIRQRQRCRCHVSDQCAQTENAERLAARECLVLCRH